MRTKALICAAAMVAAGFATAQAQVFSVNIVGYVNVVMKGSNYLTLVANPLDDGTNTANSVLAGMPNKTAIQTWNGTTFSGVSKASGSFGVTPISLPPGVGFFVKCPAGATQPSLTNTFVGNALPGPNGTNNLAVPVTLSLVGSVLPVSGNLNDVGVNSLNLNATVPNKTQVQVWDNTGATAPGTFNATSKASGAFTSNFLIPVGSGFFINKANTNWTQVLQ